MKPLPPRLVSEAYRNRLDGICDRLNGLNLRLALGASEPVPAPACRSPGTVRPHSFAPPEHQYTNDDHHPEDRALAGPHQACD